MHHSGDRDRALERLQAEIPRAPDKESSSTGPSIVVLSGLNVPSRMALMERDLIIRLFPFYIGRVSKHHGSFFHDPDLMIEDRKPYRISRFHLSIIRREDQIFLVDQDSRYGSVVNDVPLGKAVGERTEIPLNIGDNTILLGGQNTHFVFNMEVIKDSCPSALHDHVFFGDRLVPVASLYKRSCQYTFEILTSSHNGLRGRLETALDVVRLITPHPDTTQLLYYFSASPKTYVDTIVAHSVNVAIYTVKLAMGLSYSSEDVIKIGVAALLHDIGMYDVPTDIFDKREPVSLQEFEMIKKHPSIGYDKLAVFRDEFQFIPQVALEHHERSDGKGYPKGVKSLSDISELIGMVDFFEAVTHYRPQRGPVTPHEGMRMLLDRRYALFTPNLLKNFIKHFSLFPVFSVVQLNTGKIGQVVKTDPGQPLRPTVRIFLGADGNPDKDDGEIDLSVYNNMYISKNISDRVFINHYFPLS